MNLLPVYRVLTYVLLPFVALIGLMTLFALLVALANPVALLPVFILACTVIYTICSFMFLSRGINKAQACKKSLKDWIKVNAYVSMFFCVMMILDYIAVLRDNGLLRDTMQQAISMQGGSIPKNITADVMVQVAKGFFGFMCLYGILLLVHILIGFKMIRAYAYVFERE
jgi:hypothetical protein